MKNLERDRRRKKGAIGSQDGGFRTFERRTGHADGRSATCILEGGADVTVYSVCGQHIKDIYHCMKTRGEVVTDCCIVW